jgi:tRNA-specific 2-thiouridylase
MNTGQPDFEPQRQRVAEICTRLGIDLFVVDLKEKFKSSVLDYFTQSYLRGTTPNPCAICNRDIKFGLFMDHILAGGNQLGATGHYARVTDVNGEICLLKGIDPKKDQSYFLARLKPSQLSRVSFPLGEMLKEETYEFVESEGFHDFRGLESQDVCFFSDDDLSSYLARNLPTASEQGPIVTRSGEVIGHHDGLFRYTVGQRKGLGLPHHSPWYVYAIEPEENRLVVCKNEELFSSTVVAASPNWLSRETVKQGSTFTVKTRSTHAGSPARIAYSDQSSFTLVFNEPQRAVTPGQFVVLYEGERVVGSGEIVGQRQ